VTPPDPPTGPGPLGGRASSPPATGPSIAVLIPAHDAAPFIREALDSVAAQIPRLPDEVVVVDDGSRDDTAEIVRRWIRDYPGRARLVQQAQRGVSAARNTGLRAVTADLVALLDADDCLLPDHLDRLAAAFRHDTALAVCFADALVFSERGIEQKSLLAGKTVESLAYDELEGGLRLLRDSPYASLVDGNYVPTSATLISRRLLEEAGEFDETLTHAEDRDLMLRLARLGRFAYYTRVVARKRLHETNLSHPRAIEAIERCQLAVLTKMLAQTGARQLSPGDRVATEAALVRQAEAMLYRGSTLGLAAYARTRSLLFRHGARPAAGSLRHLCRAIAASWLPSVGPVQGRARRHPLP
jgi:glycosyltransferase involved in cell wall biosynthesis